MSKLFLFALLLTWTPGYLAWIVLAGLLPAAMFLLDTMGERAQARVWVARGLPPPPRRW